MPLILIYQAMEMQRERSLISGTVKMDVSSDNDNMSQLRAAFSDIRIESQPTMEVAPNISYTEYMLERSSQEQRYEKNPEFLSSMSSHSVHLQFPSSS